jgi:hypothetical protein
MQSVIRQLEIAASACPDISSAERASLCVLWSNVADALTKYLKFHMHVNQGDEKHHDLSCFYLVMLFPFYHFYSITYKQVCNQWHFFLFVKLLMLGPLLNRIEEMLKVRKNLLKCETGLLTRQCEFEGHLCKFGLFL